MPERECLGKDWDRVREIKASLSMKYILPLQFEGFWHSPGKRYDPLCAKHGQTQRRDDAILESLPQTGFCLNAPHQWDTCRKANVDLWSQATPVTAAGAAAATCTPFSACCVWADVLQKWRHTVLVLFCRGGTILFYRHICLVHYCIFFFVNYESIFFAQACVLGSGWAL